MSKVKNPPAFPRPYAVGVSEQDGMSLRDWFAGQAIFAGIDWCASHETGSYADAAAVAYEIADAMLAERAKSEGQK